MIRNTILVLLTLFVVEVYSQTPHVSVKYNDRFIGRNFSLQTDIKATEYIFPQKIYSFYLNRSSRRLTVQLRDLYKNGKWYKDVGKAVHYDLSKQKVKWTKQMFYLMCSLHHSNNTIIHTGSDRSFRLSSKDGKDLWKTKSRLFHVNPISNIGIGYKYSTMGISTNYLKGVDITSGNDIWQREITKKYGWNDFFYLNDSVLLIVADGLHTVNINNGKGWDYHTITGTNNHRTTTSNNISYEEHTPFSNYKRQDNYAINGDNDIASMAYKATAGIAVGMLTGFYFIPVSTGNNMIRGLVSNIIIDNTDLYFASEEKISRINKTNGKIVWTSLLPKDTARLFPKGITSASTIIISDNTVYLINNASAIIANNQIGYGMPYIAAFDQETGEKKFLKGPSKKQKVIIGSYIHDDALHLITEDKVSKYSTEDGKRLIKKIITDENISELRPSVESEVFLKINDSTFTHLILSDSSKSYISTSTGKILALNTELEIVEQFENDEIYTFYLQAQDYKFIANENQTYILDTQNKIIAKIEASRNAILRGNILYDFQGKSFYKIDLSELINN